MAIKNCRECGQEVSTKAKKCPKCGVKKPYRKEWKDVPLWQKVFMFIILAPIILMFIVIFSTREESLHKKVVALDDDQHKQKYEGYLKLHGFDESNSDYVEKAVKYAKLYLKGVPVTKPIINLEVYTNLAKLDEDKNYSEKIGLYSFMRDIRTQCVISAQNMSRNSLNNKSTYDTLAGSGGRWIDKSTYGYVDVFEGANSFDVKTKFTAQYLCEVDFNSKKYSVSKVSVVRE